MIYTNRIKDRTLDMTYSYLKISATDEQVAKAREFGHDVVIKRLPVLEKRFQVKPKSECKTDADWAKRESDIANCQDQAFTSKVFEFMIYNHIKSKLPKAKIVPPSCELYEQPSFDDDLVFYIDDKRYKIHVKSQDIKRIRDGRPPSWGFQIQDTIWERKANDIMVLGIYVNEKEGHLISKNYVKNFKNHLAPPKSKKLKDKVFLYFKPHVEAFKIKE